MTQDWRMKIVAIWLLIVAASPGEDPFRCHAMYVTSGMWMYNSRMRERTKGRTNAVNERR
jgi:hypothetical protein